MPETFGPDCPAPEDPQLSNLTAHDFSRYLASSVRLPEADPECAAEIERRASDNDLTAKDLWLILLKSGPDRSWVPARRAALALVERQPWLAPSIARMHDGRGKAANLGVEPAVPTVDALSGGPAYMCRVYANIGGTRVYWPRRTDRSSKRASQMAYVAYLECQAGLAGSPGTGPGVPARDDPGSPGSGNGASAGPGTADRTPRREPGPRTGHGRDEAARELPPPAADLDGPVPWRQAVAAGWAVTFVPGAGPAEPRFLVFPPEPALLQAVDGITGKTAPRRSLLLAEAGAVRPLREHCLTVRPADLAAEALTGDTEFAHPSARGWARAARLGTEMIADGLAYPGLDNDGYCGWHLGIVPPEWRARVAEAARALPAHGTCTPDPANPGRPLPAADAVGEFLDALASALVPSPGARLLLEDAPFAASDETHPHLRDFADRVEDLLDYGTAPGIILKVSAPQLETARFLTLTLLLQQAGRPPRPAASVWRDGLPAGGDPARLLKGRVRRALRKAAEHCPQLADVARDALLSSFLLSPEAAALLAGPAADKLRDLGITVEWDGNWKGTLETRVVAGTGSPSPWDPDLLTVDSLLDFRWQITLDGTVLTDAEMRAIAEAQRPLIRLRDQLVLIAPQIGDRARNPAIRREPAQQALLSVLAGTVTIDDRQYGCTPADGLRALLELLEDRHGTGSLTDPPAGLALPLKAHQHRALDWLTRLAALGFGMCLADEPGTGKTATAIAFHLHRKESGSPGPTLVLCPLVTLAQWAAEIGRFAPGVPVVVCALPNTDRNQYGHSTWSTGDLRGRFITRPGTLPSRRRGACPPGSGARLTACGRSSMKGEYRTGCRFCCRRGSSTTPS